MAIPQRLRQWWDGLSRLGRSILSLVLLIPFAELAFWGLVELVGGRQGFGVVGGIFGACVAMVLALSPKEALADPEIGGTAAEENPTVVRGICLLVAVVCFAMAVVAAFGNPWGWFKN